MLVDIRAAKLLKESLKVASVTKQFMEQSAAELREGGKNTEISAAIDKIAKACQDLYDLCEKKAAARLKQSKDLN